MFFQFKIVSFVKNITRVSWNSTNQTFFRPSLEHGLGTGIASCSTTAVPTCESQLSFNQKYTLYITSIYLKHVENELACEKYIFKPL